MKRRHLYGGQIPRSIDLLLTQRYALVGLAEFAQDMLRSMSDPTAGVSTATYAAGFVPTYPGGMSVNLAAGRIYQLGAVDTVAFGNAGTDSTQVLQQGEAAAQTLNFAAAPGVAGQSRIDLVQAKRVEADNGNTVLLYYNSANPSQPWNGVNNTGVAQPQNRDQDVTVSIKQGTAGVSPVAPTPDAGYVALYQVTIAFGTVALTGANLALDATAPFVAGLQQKHHTGLPGAAPKIDPLTEVLPSQGSALPTASAGYRGQRFLLWGATNEPDRSYECAKLGDDNYDWVQVF